jgi:riboflavin kinase / FMN adenylyltransferase
LEIITDWRDLPAPLRLASVAMGNFDGVHRGHQAVIAAARRPGLALGVATFEPHPRAFFAPDAPPFRLMNAEARRNRLARLGVERLFELPFDTALAAMTAENFVKQVLVEGLGVAHVVVGADFCFGRGRLGTAAMLADLGARHGFGVTVLPLVGAEGGAISSSAIRAALSEGRVADATAMLGHRHRIEGPVLHGDKRGRTLNYPTANMGLEGLHLPRFGVYAVRAEVLDGPHSGAYGGVASLGVRPMFGVNTPNLETHIFDFAGDLYGAHLSVALVEWLRPELRFDGLPALIAQMDADSDRARAILAAGG